MEPSCWVHSCLKLKVRAARFGKRVLTLLSCRRRNKTIPNPNSPLQKSDCRCSGVLLRVIQRNRTNSGERGWEELTRITVEAKFPELPSTNWRPSKVCSEILVQVQRPENKEPVVQILVQGQEIDVPVHTVGKEGNESFLPPLSILFRSSTNWLMSTHTGEGKLFYWLY